MLLTVQIFVISLGNLGISQPSHLVSEVVYRLDQFEKAYILGQFQLNMEPSPFDLIRLLSKL